MPPGKGGRTNANQKSLQKRRPSQPSQSQFCGPCALWLLQARPHDISQILLHRPRCPCSTARIPQTYPILHARCWKGSLRRLTGIARRGCVFETLTLCDGIANRQAHSSRLGRGAKPLRNSLNWLREPLASHFPRIFSTSLDEPRMQLIKPANATPSRSFDELISWNCLPRNFFICQYLPYHGSWFARVYAWQTKHCLRTEWCARLA